MKRIMTIALCLFLALIMSLGNGLDVYAASQNQYVSEVITYEADSYEEAKKGLEKKGYKIAGDVNLNSTLETGIYLGYKTTTNPDEAITDLATMNMLGNYSYSDYQTILENQRDAIKKGIDAIIPAIYAYQESLTEGTKEGRLVKATLNLYEEEDSGDLMGDYFEEYDFSDEKRTELTEVLLQANSAIMVNIMSALATTAGDTEYTCLEYLAEIGLDGGLEEYKEYNPGLKNAESRFEIEYSNTVTALQNGWNSMVETLNKVTEYVTFEEDGSFSINGNEDDVYINVNTVFFYIALKNCGNEQVTNFFMTEYDESMYQQLFTVAYVMTDSQRGLLTYLSPLSIFAADAYSYESAAEEEFEEILDDLDDTPTISVYEGVDRSYFEDGVAFTSAATRHEALSGTPWYSTEEGQKTVMNIVYFSFIALFAAACTICVCATEAWANTNKMERNMQLFGKNCKSEYQALKECLSDVEKVRYLKRYEEALNNYKATLQKGITIPSVIKCVAFVFFILCLIMDIVCVILYMVGKNKTTYEDIIPAHLVTAVSTDKETDYVYYTTVKDQSGDDADLNNHEGDPGKGWLVLYYTKDPLAGDPITADSFKMVQGSDNAQEGYSCIHMFNETSAVNITSENYTSVSDTVGGTYVYYKTGTQTNTAVGSAIDTSTGLLVGLGGIVIGAVAGFFLGKGTKKKKEATA